MGTSARSNVKTAGVVLPLRRRCLFLHMGLLPKPQTRPAQDHQALR